MKHSFILFLFLFINLEAQQTISGIVYNSETNSPVSFVSVSIQTKNIAASTDENGSFVLKGEFQDSDKIKFSLVGFEIQLISLKLL